MSRRGLRCALVALAVAFALCSAAPPAVEAQASKKVEALNKESEQLIGEGKYAEATPMAEQALAVEEATYGPNHAAVAAASSNLASLYQVQRRYGDAEPLYKRSLAIYEQLPDQHRALAQDFLNLGSLYDEASRYGEAEAFYKRGLSMQEQKLGPDHPDVADGLGSLSQLYIAQGRFAEAEPLLKRRLFNREKNLGPEHADVATALNNLAVVYDNLGRFAESEPLYKRSLAIREKVLPADHVDIAGSLNNLGYMYWKWGRLATAEPYYRRSLQIYESAHGAEHLDVATSIDNLGALLIDRQRYDEAERLLRRSVAMREKFLGLEHPDIASSLNNLAALYWMQKRYAEAEPLYRRSLAIREKLLPPDHPDIVTSFNNLAWLSLAQGNWADAARQWTKANAVIERRAQFGLSGDHEAERAERQQYDVQFSGLIKANDRLAPKGHPDRDRIAGEMFLTAQLAKGSQAAAALSQMAARTALGNSELAAITRDQQDLKKEWREKEKALITATSAPPETRDRRAEEDLKTHLSAIEKKLAEIGNQIANRFPEFASFASPKPVSIGEVQRALGNDEALILFVDTDSRYEPIPEETFVWVVTKTANRWVSSQLGTSGLRREVAALRCGLDTTAWYDDGTRKCADLLKIPVEDAPHYNAPLPFDPARAHALYKSLFGDIQNLIKGKQLLIVPSGALTQLPFQVLVTAPPAPVAKILDTDHRQIAWLARSNAVTVLPAVSSLNALRSIGKPSAANRPMIGFGNPLLDGEKRRDEKRAQAARDYRTCRHPPQQRVAVSTQGRGALSPVAVHGHHADLAHLNIQVPLPETADELCAVARDLNADTNEIRLGSRATETEIKALSAAKGDERLANYRVVHFATHATLAGQINDTSEPGLILTPPAIATDLDDGYLSASEIAALKLDADWVILSACNTAGPAGSGGLEALSGLARAFFYAQARALLVSHWEVESDATVKLITAAVGEITRDRTVGRAEALRRSMLALIDGGTMRDAHPSAWAPFVLVGEGAPDH